MAGKVVLAPDPPIIIFDELPPVNVPEPEIAPSMVKVFASIEREPFVKVKAPSTVTFPPKLRPFVLFSVRLLRETAGNIVLAPDPPIKIFEELPPVSVPLPEIAPLIVKVCAPIESAPSLVDVPFIMTSPDKLKVFEYTVTS